MANAYAGMVRYEKTLDNGDKACGLKLWNKDA
jgi:hypothetical protein